MQLQQQQAGWQGRRNQSQPRQPPSRLRARAHANMGISISISTCIHILYFYEDRVNQPVLGSMEYLCLGK